MTKTSKYLFYILVGILISRLFSMYFIPLTDTTEARYAEMARIMAETGDWITPYIDYNIPFWGKPPLSFWLQAISIDMFGVNEFAPRFPSWLMELATIVLIFKLLDTLANRERALWGALIYSSTLLVYALSGAVLTDPFLNLGITLSFVAFVMVLKAQQRYWGYLFFIGLSIGFLSKGPLILVLVGGTIGLWLLLSTKRWRVFMLYPWIGGVALMLLLTLPWYIMAEMKTPGFLNYFIVGEHFLRFVDSGWSGDLYGSAHQKPHGTIWLHWLVASLPWGIFALVALVAKMFVSDSLKQVREAFVQEDISFYVIWALFPMLFFTISGNVLWTYVMPALPALAILLALYLNQKENRLSIKYANALMAVVLFIPIVITGAIYFVYQDDKILPTEKLLVEHYSRSSNASQPLYCLHKKSFSIRYYTQGEAKEVTKKELQEMLDTKEGSISLAVPKKRLSSLEELDGVNIQELYRNSRFVLVEVAAKNRAAQ